MRPLPTIRHIKCLQNGPENSSSDKTTPASKLGNSAGRSLRNGTSSGLVEIPSTNIGELALLGQHSSIGSNLDMDVSKNTMELES